MNYLKRAYELNGESVANRRYLHANPEVGMELPNTTAFVMKKLKEIGLEPKKIVDSGVTATIGSGGKVILLRADMDALPMAEDSGLDFASKNGNAHTCGHDLHAAMLLTAAKLLKENEDKLKGTVKLMFQPGEEVFKGAKAMIDAGILENPKVDAAVGFHVGAGDGKVGGIHYNNSRPMMYSCDGFKITITGRGTHGAYPHFGVDPINVGMHIYQAYQELIAREVDPSIPSVMTIGQFKAGDTPNIIPQTAVIQGTIRTASKDVRKLLVFRMREVAEKIASAFNASVDIEMLSEVPVLQSDKELTDNSIKWISDLPFESISAENGIEAFASDDFAEILDRVPGSYMFLNAGFPEGSAPAHNPKVRFNEEVLPFGSACYAEIATNWLNSQTVEEEK